MSRLAEQLAKAQKLRDEHLIASFFARPEYRAVRPLLEQLVPGSTATIDALVRKVRVEQWRDISEPQ